MAAAIRDAYSDLFTIRANPTATDRKLIEGKFRSAHNVSANVAKLMAITFYSLLELADLSPGTVPSREEKPVEAQPSATSKSDEAPRPLGHNPTLHYNIQIHLHATKDAEVFSAIFKSLREHLFE